METILIVLATNRIGVCSSCADQQDGLLASGLGMTEESNCLDTSCHGMPS
jgi:hypothetical protein